MTPLWLPPEAVVPFVAGLTGDGYDFGRCRAMGVFDAQGRMVAGILFHNWNEKTGVMEVSAAATDKRWASRDVLNEAFGYVFANAQMCVARTHEGNTAVRRLWKAFGAIEYILPRLRGREASEAVLLLTDDAWAQSRFKR